MDRRWIGFVVISAIALGVLGLAVRPHRFVDWLFLAAIAIVIGLFF